MKWGKTGFQSSQVQIQLVPLHPGAARRTAAAAALAVCGQDAVRGGGGGGADPGRADPVNGEEFIDVDEDGDGNNRNDASWRGGGV